MTLVLLARPSRTVDPAPHLPNPISATALSKETGSSQQTLSRWRQQASTASPVNAKMPRPQALSPNHRTQTADDKLRLVLAASGLSGTELGEFLRREGVHTAELEEWRRVAPHVAKGL
jgi:transposase-like protein